MRVHKGQEITVDVETMALEGRSVGRLEDLVVFVDRALPGERILARVQKVKRNHVQARLVEVLQASPQRVPGRCAHLAQCGGCTWQELDYETQLEAKADLVRQAFERLAGMRDVAVAPTLPSPNRFHYRNKMEFSFYAGDDGAVVLGLHSPGTFDRVFDLDACWLMSEVSNGIVHRVRELATRSGLPAYHTRRHTGFWRYLVVRDGKNTGDIMVNLVTNDGVLPNRHAFIDSLVSEFPAIRSLLHNVNSRRATIAVGEREEVLHGDRFIEEELDGLRFRITANSFFQTNPQQAERLFQLVVEEAGLRGDEEVLDLYAGTGAISLFLARRARRVTGIEMVQESVDAAEDNARHNGIDNCRFLTGEVRHFFRKRAAEASMADVVIADPPRAGLHPNAAHALRLLQPRRIVYVSCNPSTLARDVELLCREAVYRLERVQPVDMFPHTQHVEVVTRLERVASG